MIRSASASPYERTVGCHKLQLYADVWRGGGTAAACRVATGRRHSFQHNTAGVKRDFQQHAMQRM